MMVNNLSISTKRTITSHLKSLKMTYVFSLKIVKFFNVGEDIEYQGYTMPRMWEFTFLP